MEEVCSSSSSRSSFISHRQKFLEWLIEEIRLVEEMIQRKVPSALVPLVAVPPGDGETVPVAPVPPRVEVPFVAPVPPSPPVLLAEEPVMQVEKFLRLQPPTYSGGPNPDTAEHWVWSLTGLASIEGDVNFKNLTAGFVDVYYDGSLNDNRVDSNLCDLQNIGLPEGSPLTPFSFSLALFSCPCFPTASNGCRRLVGGSWNCVVSLARLRPVRGRRTRVRHVTGLTGLDEAFRHTCRSNPLA
ncbi:hypothetical protein Taro_013271 [Colocasia esculenta]|uniref:Uncharacterized protein n=1 Tax=Colocasia esculenta TaxID=4460 RepID=A0A843UBL4_COLES|nr:hypothetical protein [Colocasia esculenta]